MSDENNTEKTQENPHEKTDNCAVPEMQSVQVRGAPRDNVENTGVAIKTIESQSLNSLLVYDSDSSSSSSASSEMMRLNLNWQVRNGSEESSTSSSSSSSEESSSEEEEENVIREESRGAIRKTVPKAKGEFSLEELPPVPDVSQLNITDDEQFVHMGNVLGIVEKLVTVAALPNMPAYDVDTLLFLECGKRPMGFVFDVLGQVTSPIYAVRFNTEQDIKNLQIEVGTKVYSAPKSKHTQYVFLQQLLKMKGTDASWTGDAEVPPEFADFSDDENECLQRSGNKRLAPHIKRTHSGDSHKRFENTMNRKNILNTKFNKYMDSYKQAKLGKIRQKLPAFDPTVPPPTFTSYSQVEFPQFVSMTGASENNNAGYHQTFSPFYANGFAAEQSRTANYFTSLSGDHYPGPSHQ